MNIKEILIEINDGKKVRRKTWKENQYIQIDRESKQIKAYREYTSYFSFDLNKNNSLEWICLDEDEKELLSLADAVEKIREGKRLRHKDWIEGHIYYHHLDRQLYCVQYESTHFNTFFEDLIANDWEVIG